MKSWRVPWRYSYENSVQDTCRKFSINWHRNILQLVIEIRVSLIRVQYSNLLFLVFLIDIWSKGSKAWKRRYSLANFLFNLLYKPWILCQSLQNSSRIIFIRKVFGGFQIYNETFKVLLNHKVFVLTFRNL